MFRYICRPQNGHAIVLRQMCPLSLKRRANRSSRYAGDFGVSSLKSNRSSNRFVSVVRSPCAVQMEAAKPSFLRNSYWVLRHGKSIPNEKGLVVSSLDNGTLEKYGLASEGFSQARLAGELLLEELKKRSILVENIRICYSPFSRTTDTAKAVADVLGIPFKCSQCKVMTELRERYFGPTFELLSHEKYSEIWALDEKDPFMPPEGGECVADVASRLASALATIEAEFEGCTILVVSHGDPLQILQTVLHAAKQHPSSGGDGIVSRINEVTVHSILSKHRSFALETGELRQVIDLQ